MAYFDFQYSYRWEKNVLALCRIIGDPDRHVDTSLRRQVREYGDELGCAHDNDVQHLSTTFAIFVGVWAWLKGVSDKDIMAEYPVVTALAIQIRDQLGDMTPDKRWVAGRLFVGIRIWLQELDHDDPRQPQHAIGSYPSLSS